MTRPTLFEVMRRNRRNARRRQDQADHLAEVEAFQFQHSEDVEHRLREIDIDKVHAKRAVRRWWWPVSWVAAALQPRNNLEKL